MARLVVDQPEQVQAWVAECVGSRGWSGATAIGLVDDNDRLICGVVYHDLRRCVRTDKPLAIAGTVAASPRTLTRPHSIPPFFVYPFEQLGVERFDTVCPADQPHIRRFNEKLGFVEEAVLPSVIATGTDGVLYRMLRSECPWLNGDGDNG